MPKSIDSERRGELRRLFELAVKDAITQIQGQGESGERISCYSDFPKIERFETSGLPRVYLDNSDCNILDYTSCFRNKTPHSWQDLAAFVVRDTSLARIFNDFQAASDTWIRQHLPIFIQLKIASLVDRYLHRCGPVFREENFKVLYNEFERRMFDDFVEFEVIFPILFLDFEIHDSVAVGHSCELIRLNDDLQLARLGNKFSLLREAPHVTSGANYGFKASLGQCKNNSPAEAIELLTSQETIAKQIQEFHDFLAAIRCVCQFHTGFNQAIVCPKAFWWFPIAKLPEVHLVSFNEYPHEFENYGWLNQPPLIKKDRLSEISSLFTRIHGSQKLALAVSRLNLAFLRQSEEDSILDLTIGLESLFVNDGASGEISYKLRTRMAALAKSDKDAPYDAKETARISKLIYKYRSQIAHGSNINKRKSGKQESDDPLKLAQSLLCYSIIRFANDPQYHNPDELEGILFSKD